MKRGLLIGVGTLGSLGAVFAITPPQFGTSNSTGSALGLGSTPATTPSTTAPTSSTPAPQKTTAPAQQNSEESDDGAPSNATVTPQKTTPAPTKTATPAPTKTATTTPAPAQTQTQSTGSNGTFVGNVFPADEYGRNWGNVHVTVTLNNGKITAITGDQSPASRGYMAFNQIDPYVAGQKISVATIKSTSASSLPYVSGATYSSIAYWDSLKTALKKAGI